MGIWIRTQDGNSLLLCTDINIKTQGKEVAVFNGDQMLGKYEDMEEAWIIVDCIQKQIENKNIIFGMPEAGVICAD